MHSSTARDIYGTIRYWGPSAGSSEPDHERGDDIVYRYHEQDPRKMQIQDLRTHEADFTLQKNGFQFLNLGIKERDVTSEERIKDESYAEVADIIKRLTQCHEVIVFNHVYRSHLRTDNTDPSTTQPAPRPHVDFTSWSARNVVLKADHLKEYAEKVVRFQLIGFWRPVKTIQRDPIVFADTTSIPDEDFILLKRKDARAKENYILRAGEGSHSWWWVSEQQPHEAVVFKHYDSKEGKDEAWRCPHTSVEWQSGENLPARESIEFRALACYY